MLPALLLQEGSCTPENFFEPSFAETHCITSVHDPSYYSALLNLTIPAREARKIGFPLSAALVDRERIIAGGTIKAAEFALENGIAMNIAGGTHHAYSNHGEAFCMLNDQAIGARYLQSEALAKQVLIIDLDVHQGNGTAEIFRDDPTVFTFSMHGEGNYPFKKEQSDLDIPMKKGTTDAEYLSVLGEALPHLITEVRPDFVFYLCGVDVLATDALGTLSLSLEGCRQRDQQVFECCRQNNIPIQCSMGGGYSPDLNTIVDAHANTFRLAQELFF